MHVGDVFYVHTRAIRQRRSKVQNERARLVFRCCRDGTTNQGFIVAKLERRWIGVMNIPLNHARFACPTRTTSTTWEAVAKIETDALITAKMNAEQARATVAKAIQALKDSGVTAPIRIPWGKVQ